jgi:biopolymer transport protein ExbB
MKSLLVLYEKGGPVMIAIAGLSVVLYTCCFQLLFRVYQDRQWLKATPSQLPALRRHLHETRDSFRHQRLMLGAMIAAAPLLGLLGTVSGMIKTFESLANRVGEKSMEGLAQGISEVLVATESGLAVALPALLLVYLAHRAVHRNLQKLDQRETSLRAEPRP